MTKKPQTIYIILEDGENFGGALNSTVVIQDCKDEELANRDDDIYKDLSEHGDIDSLYSAIRKKKVPGKIFPVRKLFKLRSLVGNLKIEDANDPVKMEAFLKKALNLKIF